MNLDGLRVNHAGLEQAADDMRTTVQRIDERMDRLESELEGLRNSWAGNAQQAYVAAKAKWDAAIGEMRDLLADTSMTVNQSNDEYRAADQRGAASFDI